MRHREGYIWAATGGRDRRKKENRKHRGRKAIRL